MVTISGQINGQGPVGAHFFNFNGTGFDHITTIPSPFVSWTYDP
jgi:hypothetical protein